MNQPQLHDASSAALDAAASDPQSAQPRPQPAFAICPYCGHESVNIARCDRCRGLLDPLSRQASQNAMGPWFIRDEAAPFRPGCSYETLCTLIAKGRISRDSIVRGPTTRQFWMRARSAPGVAHLLGECHACHAEIAPDLQSCSACAASFVYSSDRQSLGLAQVRLLPGHSAPEDIARSMVETIRPAPARTAVAAPAPSFGAAAPVAIAADADSFPLRRPPSRIPLGLLIGVAIITLLAVALVTIWVVAPTELESLWRAIGGGGGAPAPSGGSGGAPASTPPVGG